MPARSPIHTRTHWLAATLGLALVAAGCGSGTPSPAALAERGYKPDAQSTCKAAVKGDLEAVRMLAQSGPAAKTLLLDGERFCLEAVLTGKTAQKTDAAAVINELKPAPAEFNRVYPSSLGMTARDVPQAEALARAAGQRATDFYANGAVVEATPLMWAVWSGDLGAVQAMLAQGADPNLASVVPVRITETSQSDGIVRITTTPLFEAHRLKQVQIAQALTQRGGKPLIGVEKRKG